MRYASDDWRWRAVATRDARHDGRFVYAVRSTHVFCRPSCPSRRPRPERVTYFPTPDAARAAGFRACRRCRPGEAPRDPRAELVHRACRALDAAERPLGLAELARAVDAPADRLRRAFVALTGITPRQYADGRRAERLRRDLRAGRGVSRALYDAGYGSPSRVYGRPLLGMTPATYARGGRGAVIRYTIEACALGRLLVAATPRGVCRVSMGDDAARLIRDLRHEFPAATLLRDRRALGPAVRRILASVAGRPIALDLPLDVRATTLQWRVWDALRRIPRGTTRSYQAVARAIGRPRAVRAVARACASNPVAIIVPCHRVVRADGQLGGYRWGVERKRQLLRKERSTK
jgi:AraC family transcriptional regulator of adaptative response/methylated-DNA-[protein]-cysteine methyltransferase